MGHIYAEFDSTQGTIVADLKAKILTSSDYSNPTGNVVKATTPLGATIAVDLTGLGAADGQRIRPYFYRTFPGTGPGVDPLNLSLYFRQNGNLAASNPIHCKVAAGPTLLYIELEGPRSTEPGADSTTYGTGRQCLFAAQMTPYFAADTVPAVVVGGSSSYPGTESALSAAQSMYAYVSRNQANSQSWVVANLYSLSVPNAVNQTTQFNYSPVASDGNTYLLPYVVMEQVAGMRGRLTDLFFAGWNPSPQYAANSIDYANGFRVGDSSTYGGNTYKITAPYKTAVNNWYVYGPLGAAYNPSSNLYSASPLVAVRTA